MKLDQNIEGVTYLNLFQFRTQTSSFLNIYAEI
jgi:hypothetical protein